MNDTKDVMIAIIVLSTVFSVAFVIMATSRKSLQNELASERAAKEMYQELYRADCADEISKVLDKMGLYLPQPIRCGE